MEGVLLLGFAAVGILGLGAPAFSCSCVGAQIDVAPVGDIGAPINTHVWVLAPPSLESNPPAEPKPLPGVDVELRGPDDQVVATERDTYVVGSLLVVELAPVQSLNAATAYHVLVSLPEEAGRSNRGEFGLASHARYPAGSVRQTGERSWRFTFVTGNARDEDPPRGHPVSWARLSQAGSRAGMCETGEAEIRIGLNHPINESRAHPDLVAIWLGHPSIDTAGPPDGFLLVDDVVSLGRPGYCSVRTASVTERSVVGVARVDLAGNRSGTDVVRFPGDRAPSDHLVGEVSGR